MSDAFVVQVSGEIAGIVVRDRDTQYFSFFAAARRFDLLEGQQFAEPCVAERAARRLIANYTSRRNKPPLSAKRRIHNCGERIHEGAQNVS
jgi:hypothetical protein